MATRAFSFCLERNTRQDHYKDQLLGPVSWQPEDSIHTREREREEKKKKKTHTHTHTRHDFYKDQLVSLTFLGKQNIQFLPQKKKSVHYKDWLVDLTLLLQTEHSVLPQRKHNK
jgi:hypothetical protein